MTQKSIPELPELTDLTLEAFHALEAEGRIHQISRPLTVRVPFGPAGNIKAGVESAAVSHGANAYMMGDALQTEAGLVVPVTLYQTDSPSQSAETIIEPVGVQPVVFDNLTIYHPNGQPFRTYQRVVLDGALQEGSKTQAGWIEHYAGTQRQLPSFPVLYAMIEDIVRSGNSAKEGLLADVRAYWIATSTRPQYRRSVMIHDAGREPFELPCRFPNRSDNARDLNEDGQQTLKALLMPRDLANALQTLQTFSNLSPYISVPDNSEDRQATPEMAAFAYAGLVVFNLSCRYHPVNYGRSRGVALE